MAEASVCVGYFPVDLVALNPLIIFAQGGQSAHPVPSTWFDLDSPEQLDWMIDHHFRIFVRWIGGWITAADRGAIEVRFITFEDMLKRGKEFLVDLARYCGLEETLFTEALPDLRSDDAVLFRVGQVDEWRRVFSPAQIERVDRLLRSLRERFGWLV